MEANMDGLKNGLKLDMEGFKDGLKENMEDKMDGLKEDMDGLKEGLTKLLQEKLPNGEKLVEGTNDENKRNINHDFIDYNVGLKAHHVPKIDMRKFDGKDPVTWIL